MVSLGTDTVNSRPILERARVTPRHSNPRTLQVLLKAESRVSSHRVLRR